MNIIATALNESYWNPWGISWLGSLLEVAETKNKIIVFNYGLSAATVKKIKDVGVEVVAQKATNNIRQSCIDLIAEISQQSEDKYVYYDADVWFQGKFDNLFDMIDDKLLITKNHNCGFIAGSKDGWAKYNLIRTFASKVHDANHFSSLFDNFECYANQIDNTYNCIQIPELQEMNYLLCVNETPQVAIHTTGTLKKMIARKNIAFHERYPEIYNKFIEHKKISSHRMLSKNIHPPVTVRDESDLSSE